MSRTKGTYTLTSNIEPKVGAPLDARTVVKLLTDLTANNTFEYPYKGMTVFVEENTKTYTLIGTDPTVATNWVEVGSGSGGHTILDPESTEMTQRPNLQFMDAGVNDDSINEVTKIENIQTIEDETDLADAPDGIYVKTVAEQEIINAGDVSFDNTDSGLQATNTQDAIDEVVGSLGTAASKDVPASGDASTTQVVMGNDTRLTDARTPVSHTHATSDITGLGTAATANTTNSISQGGTDVPTAGAVWSAIDNLPEPMILKGTLGTGGTITSLPTAAADNEGFTYKVITAGTYAGQAAKVGDFFVSCKPVGASAYEWVWFPSGDESFTDTWRNIKVNGTELLGNGISTGAVNFKSGSNVTISGSGNDITISAQDTTYSKATAQADGLMSKEDFSKLSGIETGAQVNTITGVKGNSESSYRTGNVNITKDNIGLGNVNNTSDKNKPLSDATKEALLMKIGVEAITNYYEPSMTVEMGRYAEGSNIYVESEGRMYRATTDIDIGDTLVVDTNCVPIDIQYMLMEKLGVDNLTTIVEPVDRASSAHTMYSRFYLGYLNKWAKATANIAVNDMLVMGTNYNIITIEDVFGSIESSISQISSSLVKYTAYGTCSTAADVKDKVATLSNAGSWRLVTGVVVGIRYTYTNTYDNLPNSRITLNVNNTGAKTIRYSDDVWTATTDTKCPTAYGEADQTIYYMYDGTNWVWVSHSKDNDTLYNFKGNEFRSIDGNNSASTIGMGGNANNIKVNGHYYYNSNGPGTDIGASATDGALYVQALDSDYAVQIAQNYENGNIFVRGLNDGTWTDWKRPSANIISNNTVLTTDKSPYLNRQCLTPTGFSGYVREKLIGCSVAWNQLVQNGNFANGTTNWTLRSGVTASVSGGICTITPASANLINILQAVVSGRVGRKIFVSMWVKSSDTIKITMQNAQVRFTAQNSGSNTWEHVCGIYQSVETDEALCITNVTSANAYQIKDVTLTDLTLAFGSTVADTLYAMANNGGIDWLRNHNYPIDQYTQYGYGLYSSKPSAKKVVGKNLCEEKWRQGDWNETTALSRVSIQNDSRVFLRKDVTYYIYNSGYSTIYWSAALIYHKDDSAFFTTIPWKSTETFAYTPSQDCYLAIVFKKANDGNITPQDVYDNVNFMVCHNSITDKSYTPYSCTTYSLGSTELRGHLIVQNGEIVAEGDVRESNGNVTRNYGIVDLGGLSWTATTGSVFYTDDLTAKKVYSTGVVENLINSKYTGIVNTTSVSSMTDKTIKGQNGALRIYIKDSAYTDAATFKTAMNGVYVIYELATPTTETSSPFADPMSLNGCTTEEYVDDRSIPVPVGHETQYMGQSEDVVEIPSMPQSDGIRYMKAITSGGKTQLVWEDDVIEDVSDCIVPWNDEITISDIKAYKIGHTVTCKFTLFVASGHSSGDYVARFKPEIRPLISPYFVYVSGQSVKQGCVMKLSAASGWGGSLLCFNVSEGWSTSITITYVTET